MPDRACTDARPQLLAVCASLKPAQGRKEPSACRELLKLALAPVAAVLSSIDTLDLREAKLPPFDGRDPWEYDHPALMAALAAVERAAGYVFSLPAYWGGVGAGFKNFIETVSGPGYDGRHSPFAGKPVAAMIVGSGPTTAHAAARQMEAIIDALGLVPVCPLVTVGDPSDVEEVTRAAQELTAAAGSVVLAMPAALVVKPSATRA